MAERVVEAMVYRHTELLLTEDDLPAAIAAEQAKLASPTDAPAEILRELDDLARRRRVNLQALQDGLITADDFAEANRPLMVAEERLRAELDGSGRRDILTSLDALRAQPIAALLGNVRALPVEEQVMALRAIYSRIELAKGRLLFRHVGDILPPVERPIPNYYSLVRGRTDLGF